METALYLLQVSIGTQYLKSEDKIPVAITLKYYRLYNSSVNIKVHPHRNR